MQTNDKKPQIINNGDSVDSMFNGVCDAEKFKRDADDYIKDILSRTYFIIPPKVTFDITRRGKTIETTARVIDDKLLTDGETK